jgi:hypothetical protein
VLDAINVDRGQCDTDASAIAQHAAKHHRLPRDRSYGRPIPRFINSGDGRLALLDDEWDDEVLLVVEVEDELAPEGGVGI